MTIPGQRVVDLLNGAGLLGPEFEQVGGHIRVRFRDTSQQPSGLDSVATGIDLIGWGLIDLHDLEIEPNTTQILTEDPAEREALVSFLGPEGVDRPVILTVTATDVLGCSTQVDFSVFLGDRSGTE